MRWRAFLPSRGEAVAAGSAGLLFALAFPPVPLVVPAFLCLVPVAVVAARLADGRGTWKQALRLGFWFGLIAFVLTLYWIAFALAIYTKLAFLGFFGALLVLTPVTAAGGAALFAARRTTRWPLAILLPVAWVSVEMALMHMSDLSFPWLPLGLAVARVPRLAQAAELVGVHGLSFWIAATSGALADAWLLRARWSAVAFRLLAIAMLASGLWAYGGWRMGSIVMTDIAPIAIVQPNVPQEDKWQAENQGRIIGMLLNLTRIAITGDSAAGRAPQLVLWPEVALPGFLPEHPEWETDVSMVSARSRVPILFGVLDVNFPAPGQFEYFNAAMLADSAGSIRSQPPYHKSFLVPVVERVPFLDPRWFRKLRYFGGFGRGGTQPPFTLPFGKVGVLICYESIFPSVTREYRRAGAVVIVNITNDAWFGRSLAPWQHEAHLALRAIENRVAIVRAANTGISGYVDPLGVFHGETELLTASTRTFMAQRVEGRTLYVMLGDWIGWLSVAATVALLAATYERRRRAA